MTAKPPKTKRIETKQNYFDHEITDDYIWLEDYKSKEVLSWVDLQNKYERHNSFVKNNKLHKSLSKHFNLKESTVPQQIYDSIFWMERVGNNKQSSIFYQKLDNKKVELVDINDYGNGNSYVSKYSISPQGKYIAYAISDNGDEISDIYIKEIDTNRILKERLEYNRYPKIVWNKSESGFYYSKLPSKDSTTNDAKFYNQKIFFHLIGQDPSFDEYIFGNELEKEDMFYYLLSLDDERLYVTIKKGWSSVDIYLYETKDKKSSLIKKKYNANFNLKLTNQFIYSIIVNANSTNSLVRYKYEDKKLLNYEVITTENNNVIEGYFLTKNFIIVRFLNNAYTQLVSIHIKTFFEKTIQLKDLGYVKSIKTNIQNDTIFYSFESFCIPQIIFQYDLQNNESNIHRKTRYKNPMGMLKIEQKWSISKDGTKVPMFIIYKKNLVLDSTNPSLIFGYGGFGSNVTPGFYKTWMPFLNDGGILVVGIIRGGGEFGTNWHLSAVKSNKQKSYDDFISIPKYLIENNYTNSQKIASIGSSNGGLLTLACMVQEPNLFKAVISRVPLCDMVRFPKFLIASRWIDEYGDPSSESELSDILKWSPYHNIRSYVQYPSTFIVTGLNDSRVAPLHAFKMTALLQTKDPNQAHFLFIDKNAGHGIGKPINKALKEIEHIYSFLYKELDMKNL